MTAQSVSHPARTFAACTHLTMVRVYSYVLRCDSCGNYGPFGWLYRCSQDQEEILRDSILSGDEVTFDELGRRLITAVQPRNRGPERRSGNAACFLEEMPPKDITTTYTSDQLLTIFNQRKHLGEVLRRESFRKKSTSTQGHDGARQSTTYDLDDILSRNISTPWVPSAKDECMYKICPYCRPGGADRAYISLDGVVEGNIPATAATGYGFHFFRQRPVCSSSLVANLGLRPTTASMGTSASASYHTSSDASTNDIGSARPINQLASQLNLLSMANDTRSMSPYPLPHAQLPRSVGSPDLAAQVAVRQDTSGGDSSWQDTTASTVSVLAGASGQDGEDSTDMEEHEKEEGKFLAQPLEVAHGVAMLEESVERHSPDLVTQV